MTYVALLRGINVGGNRKVPMKQLAATFERLGMENVRTYINSGNVVFRRATAPPAGLQAELEAAIEEEFGFPVTVLVRDIASLRALASALPDEWADGPEAKCDVLFLAEEVDRPEVMDALVIKPGIDDVRYEPGAILWRVERPLVTRSGLMRIVGTDLYQRLTGRNCNTLRKLAKLAEEVDAAQ